MAKLHISLDVVQPVERILAELGADLPDLVGSELGVDIAAADAMMEAAARQLGDQVGIDVAAQVPLGALGPVDYALSTSATLRDGLTSLARFYGVATERITLRVLDEPVAGFELERRAGASHSRYWIEFSLALIVQRLRAGVGSAMRVAEVTFQHDAPASLARHEAFFEAPVKFSAPTDRVALPRPTFALPLRTSQPFLAQTLQKKLDEIETAISGDVTLRRVCKVLSDSLGDPQLSIDTVAQRLAMSRRSLQRHLGELDTSFRALLDDIRCQRARSLLEDAKMTPTEISRELGFADASAFFRALRRWTGETPGALRTRSARARSGS